MRISGWSSDVCSSDLNNLAFHPHHPAYLTSDVDEARNYASMDAEVDGGTPIVLTLKIAHPMPAFLPFMLLQDLHLPQHEGLCASLRAQGYNFAVANEPASLEPVVFGARHLVSARSIQHLRSIYSPPPRPSTPPIS